MHPAEALAQPPPRHTHPSSLTPQQPQPPHAPAASRPSLLGTPSCPFIPFPPTRTVRRRDHGGWGYLVPAPPATEPPPRHRGPHTLPSLPGPQTPFPPTRTVWSPQCLVAKDLSAVSGVERELRALGVGFGPQVFCLAGSHMTACVLFDCGGPFGLVEQREGVREVGVEGNGGCLNLPFSVVGQGSCSGLCFSLLVAGISNVCLDPDDEGGGSARVEGIDGVGDDVGVRFVLNSWLFVSALPSGDEAEDGHAIRVDCKLHVSVSVLEGRGECCEFGVRVGGWPPDAEMARAGVWEESCPACSGKLGPIEV
eukprot:3847150-Rhodomonas_salina.1